MLDKCLRGNKTAPLWHMCQRGANLLPLSHLCSNSLLHYFSIFNLTVTQFSDFSPAFILKLLNGGSVRNHKTFGPAQLLAIVRIRTGTSTSAIVVVVRIFQRQKFSLGLAASSASAWCMQQVPLSLSQWQKIM